MRGTIQGNEYANIPTIGAGNDQGIKNDLCFANCPLIAAFEHADGIQSLNTDIICGANSTWLVVSNTEVTGFWLGGSWADIGQ